jgi:hypothetical protein
VSPLRQALLVAAALTLVGTACGLLGSMPGNTPTGRGLTPSVIPSSIATSDQLLAVATGTQSSPACTSTRLSEAKSLVAQYLANRATQLGTLSTRIQNATSIPAADVSQLQSIISNEKTGITDGGISGLETLVPNATTCLQVIGEARTMVLDFRVYAVVSPQVDLTAVASTESSIISKATALEPKILAAISAAQQKGANVTGAQSALANLETEISNAQSEVGQISISWLLTQQPSDYPADSATLAGYHNDVTSAAAGLRAAYEDARTIITDLKG